MALPQRVARRGAGGDGGGDGGGAAVGAALLASARLRVALRGDALPGEVVEGMPEGVVGLVEGGRQLTT